MHRDLLDALDILREGPRDVEDDIQSWFVEAIDYENDAYSDAVDVLARSVSNIGPSLAVRLALWYLYHDGFDAALAVATKALGRRSHDPEVERSRAGILLFIAEALDYEINAVRVCQHDVENEQAKAEEGGESNRRQTKRESRLRQAYTSSG